MNDPIPMSAPEIDEADVAAVVAALRSGRLALGPWLTRFEHDLARYVGTAHAVAVSSGTAALHLIVRGLDLAPGDEVLVPSFTFAASVNVLLYEGLRPVFVDIEPATFNLDPADAERRITPRTRALMAVDVFGHPADWGSIGELARRHGLTVIDDACEALGAEYQGRKLGGFGRAAAFAFYPNKQITTGEGGAIVTDDADLAALARSLRNQGRDAMGSWLTHERLGFNYRMSELAAALGTSQLARLESILGRREAVARAYERRLAGLAGLRAPRARPDVRVSWFVYVVTLDQGFDRDRVGSLLEAQGIPVRGYFSPLHTQPYIRERLGVECSLPVTESVARRTLALPFHTNLPEAHVARVVEALAAVLDEGPR